MDRPVIRDLNRSFADVTLEVLALLVLVLLVGLTIYYYPQRAQYTNARQMVSAVKVAILCTFT